MAFMAASEYCRNLLTRSQSLGKNRNLVTKTSPAFSLDEPPGKQHQNRLPSGMGRSRGWDRAIKVFRGGGGDLKAGITLVWGRDKGEKEP